MSADHEQAQKDYMSGMKYRELAEKYQVSINTIKSWKQRYKWDKKSVHTKPEKGRAQKKDAPASIPNTKTVKEDDNEVSELTEKQILFCLYYLKLRNITMAAIKAGYGKAGAHVAGSRLLRNVKVRAYLDKLREEIRTEIFLEATDVIQEYMKMAFADITDYVTFGQKEVQAMGAFGPIYEGEGEDKKPVMKTINYVDFMESDSIDGTLISEVKQGRDGVSVKFHDKMKALEKLEKYLDLLPDEHRRRIENEKLKIDQERLAIDRKKTENPNGAETEDWIKALEEVASKRRKKNGGEDDEQ